MRSPIAVTLGDPAGIGPEILLKSYINDALDIPFIAVGDEWVMRYAAARLGLSANIHIINDVQAYETGALNVLDCAAITGPDGFEPGVVSAIAGDAAWLYIKTATQLALNKQVSAIVTLPVNKEAVQINHPGFTGHTEMIAQMCGQSDYTMMLRSDKLTVTHVNTHVSMLESVRTLTSERILQVIRLTNGALAGSIKKPRIAIAGLNPHAGENGMFGQEEINHIIPAVTLATSEGINATGPYPPDTVFLRASRGEFDAVVCMYHDQGHIPLKLLDFDGGVNVTLGLRVIRTSVDHGTAFDIAYKGIAHTGSFVLAFTTAREMTGG